MACLSQPLARCWVALVALLTICSIANGSRSCFASAFQTTIDGGRNRRFSTTPRRQGVLLFSEQPPSVQKKRVSKIKKDAANNDNEEEEDDAPKAPKSSTGMVSGKARWESLPAKAQETIRKAAQARAIANKKKREPAEEKKQRMMMFYKKAQQERKMASRITRPLKFTERTPLASLAIGSEVNGTVISLTTYGAYVDIGTDCDGLLHISQLSRDFFVEHPRQVVSPGQNVTVRVTSTNPSMKKLHLSMLPKGLTDDEDEEANLPGALASSTENDGDDDVIRLEELDIDDELWGEIVRVTDYGAYINVGAEVDAFMHFMDHPWFARYEHPREYMAVGQRVRVWISNLERETPGKRRIKLTANRPTHLPGPRRDSL